MLAELVERLVKLGQAVDAPKVVTVDALRKIIIQGKDGEHKMHDIPPKDRAHDINSYDDIGRIIDVMGDEDSEVWVDDGVLCIVLDGEVRRDRVEVTLGKSALFDTLANMESDPLRLSPREAVKFMRFDMAGEFPHLEQAFGRVNFKRKSDGSVVTEHGNESMGKAVEAVVQNIENIPPTFTAEIPIWKNSGFLGYKASIKVGVYIDMEAECFEFRTLPDQCELAVNSAVSQLATDLRANLACPVFEGCP
jgi:hypothetical protein